MNQDKKRIEVMKVLTTLPKMEERVVKGYIESLEMYIGYVRSCAESGEKPDTFDEFLRHSQ